MNKTTGMTINAEKKEIIITKAFKKAMSVYGSKEYEAFVGVRKDLPDYEIKVKEIEKKEGKVSYAGLTIFKMQAAVQVIAGEEKAEIFKKQASVYEGEKGKYATVKKIFLKKYKDDYAKLTVDEMVEVDRIAKELELAAKEREAAKEMEEATAAPKVVTVTELGKAC